ncbi:MAG: type II toxin-antitoxin system Phd/YefM family antitoxin [Spirochaetaceae bacterium]|nr:MAG: type II toxin-antitoxin system Phd/YefM family antitoxin [Spirochaetaceae bacterium]
MNTWQLQTAKARFSELVNQCLAEGPQTITRHGEPAVVMIPAEEYARMCARSGSLRDFLLTAPRVELDVTRTRDIDREVDL